MEPLEGKRKINWLLSLISLSCIAVISVSFYFFFLKKDFDFIVEVSCDSSKEECFVRDCESIECPPNNLSLFKRYTVKAKDFKYCENENCAVACENNQIQCEVVPCEVDEEYGESCVFGTDNNIDNLN
jgi:hypothetical protein